MYDLDEDIEAHGKDPEADILDAETTELRIDAATDTGEHIACRYIHPNVFLSVFLQSTTNTYLQWSISSTTTRILSTTNT